MKERTMNGWPTEANHGVPFEIIQGDDRDRTCYCSLCDGHNLGDTGNIEHKKGCAARNGNSVGWTRH